MAAIDIQADFDTQLAADIAAVLDNLDSHTQGLNLPELAPTGIAVLALAPAASFVAAPWLVASTALVATLWLLELGY